MNALKNMIRRMRVLVIRGLVAGKADFPLQENILILAPHPDDEVIGCGGLISRLVRQGLAPSVVILSGGGESHKGCCPLDEKTLVTERRKLTLRAADVVGLPQGHIHFLDFMDGSISGDDKENMTRLRKIVGEVSPQLVLVPHSGEGWNDHLATRRIGLDLAEEMCVTQVYEYCVWMWYYNVWRLDWRSARLLRLDKDGFGLKLAAMDAYTKPLAPCGKPWSGVLPKVFLWAGRWNRELYFKVK